MKTNHFVGAGVFARPHSHISQKLKEEFCYGKQSAEETGHACAIAEYMAKREAEAKVDKVDVVPQGWGSPTEVFEHALEHERHVSRLIDELVHLASEEKDNATRDFLWGFVREQVEEEANFLNIVNLMKKAGESGILFMDAKLGERQS